MAQNVVLSVLMLAGIALALGGTYLLATRRAARRQALLMLLAALVMFGNVAVWLVPVGDQRIGQSGEVRKSR